MSEQVVDRHNARELWRDVANHLTVAHESIVQAQAALEDLATYGVAGGQEYADLLQPHVDAMRRAASDATQSAGGES